MTTSRWKGASAARNGSLPSSVVDMYNFEVGKCYYIRFEGPYGVAHNETIFIIKERANGGGELSGEAIRLGSRIIDSFNDIKTFMFNYYTYFPTPNVLEVSEINDPEIFYKIKKICDVFMNTQRVLFDDAISKSKKLDSTI